MVNVQPAGEMLCEEYFRAGGLPAVMAELLDQGKLKAAALTCNGRTIEANVKGQHTWDRRTIKAYDEPMKKDAGFLHMTGNLFDSAIMKTSVISDEFRRAFLEDPKDPNAFECQAVVFDGPEDYYKRVETANIDERTIMVMRGAGPIGYPGAAEVVNMTAPGHLLKKGLKYWMHIICLTRFRPSVSKHFNTFFAKKTKNFRQNPISCSTGDTFVSDVQIRIKKKKDAVLNPFC